jgi:uncharacterized protein
MYVVGAAHPNKTAATRLLERCVARNVRLVTDAEVFQEILHRYTAIQRRDAIQPTFEALLGFVDDVFPIALDDVQHARALLLGPGSISARDALHVAVMQRHGIEQVMTFDTGFDSIQGIRRISD